MWTRHFLCRAQFPRLCPGTQVRVWMGHGQREDLALRCPCPSGVLRSCPPPTPVSPPGLPAPGPSLQLLPLCTLFSPVSTRLTLLSPPSSSPHPLGQLLFWPLLAQTPSPLVESPPSNTPHSASYLSMLSVSAQGWVSSALLPEDSPALGDICVCARLFSRA